MLFDLEVTGGEVYYVAPAFHQPEELNDAFLTGNVRNRSLWVRPSQIGPISDRAEHHVSFERTDAWAFFSEPRRLDGPRDFHSVAERLEELLRQHGSRPLRLDIADLAEKVALIAEKRRDIHRSEIDATQRQLSQRTPLEQVAHYSSVFFECQFLLVQRRESNASV